MKPFTRAETIPNPNPWFQCNLLLIRIEPFQCNLLLIRVQPTANQNQAFPVQPTANPSATIDIISVYRDRKRRRDGELSALRMTSLTVS